MAIAKTSAEAVGAVFTKAKYSRLKDVPEAKYPMLAQALERLIASAGAEKELTE